MENLKLTLEELYISFRAGQNITFPKFLEMRSMPKLKVLNYFKPWDRNNYEQLKKNLPQLTNNNPKKKWKHQSNYWWANMSNKVE